MWRAFLSAVLLGVTSAQPVQQQGATRPAVTAAEPVAPKGSDRVLNAVVRDLCSRQVALLGEADHGDGETITFKAKLVEALVTRCGYRAVFFEAPTYDFLEVMRRIHAHEPVTSEHVASALSQVWSLDREVTPLLDFVTRKAIAGQLTLGGIDDMVGSRGAFYENDQMPVELTQKLPAERRSRCREILQQRINFTFVEGHPYAAVDQAAIQACLSESAAALPTRQTRGRSQRHMIASAERWIDRDFFSPEAERLAGERSMFLNFQWVMRRLPRGTKAIVWGATTHLAKDASHDNVYPAARSFGSYVHQSYGRGAFTLGFSAQAGAHFAGRKLGAQPLPVAQPGSIEAQSFATTRNDVVYIGPAGLRDLGTSLSGAFRHDPGTTDWSAVVDAMVIFREERSTTRTDVPSIH